MVQTTSTWNYKWMYAVKKAEYTPKSTLCIREKIRCKEIITYQLTTRFAVFYLHLFFTLNISSVLIVFPRGFIYTIYEQRWHCFRISAQNQNAIHLLNIFYQFYQTPMIIPNSTMTPYSFLAHSFIPASIPAAFLQQIIIFVA